MIFIFTGMPTVDLKWLALSFAKDFTKFQKVPNVKLSEKLVYSENFFQSYRKISQNNINSTHDFSILEISNNTDINSISTKFHTFLYGLIDLNFIKSMRKKFGNYKIKVFNITRNPSVDFCLSKSDNYQYIINSINLMQNDIETVKYENLINRFVKYNQIPINFTKEFQNNQFIFSNEKIYRSDEELLKFNHSLKSFNLNGKIKNLFLLLKYKDLSISEIATDL